MLRADTLLSYDFTPLKEPRAHCRVRIFRTPTGDVVIISELAENRGVSVTNAIEEIATGIAHLYSLDPATTTWIEHYNDNSFRGRPRDRETWTAVSFTWQNRNAVDPHWRTVYTSDIARLLPNHMVDLLPATKGQRYP